MVIDLDELITLESGLAFAQERFHLNAVQTEALGAYLETQQLRGDLRLSAVYAGKNTLFPQRKYGRGGGWSMPIGKAASLKRSAPALMEKEDD